MRKISNPRHKHNFHASSTNVGCLNILFKAKVKIKGKFGTVFLDIHNSILY